MLRAPATTSEDAIAFEVLSQAIVQRGRHITSLESWFEELAAVKPERCRELARNWLSGSKPSILVATRSGKFGSGLGFDADIKVLALTLQPQAKRKVGHRSR